MCLDYKKEGKFRDINVGVISLIGVGALIAYIRNTQQFFWIVLLGGVVLLLLYIIYVPVFSRKWRAKKIAGEKGAIMSGYKMTRLSMEIRMNPLK